MKNSSLILISVLFTHYGCSFINEFDELLPPQAAMGGQTSRAEESSSATDTGNSEGDNTTSSGGTSGVIELEEVESDAPVNMPTETIMAEQGLIVSFPVPGTDSATSLFAISPQDGSILNTLPLSDGEVTFAAHEAARDLWFLNIDNVITAAYFDRLTNEWTLREPGPGSITINDAQNVIALPNYLALFSGGKLKVFDTSDVDDIKPLPDGEKDFSSRGALWDMAALSANSGGRIYLLMKECASGCALTQSYEVNVIQVLVSGGSVGESSAGMTTVSSVLGSKPNSQGQLITDELAEEVIVMIPNEKGKDTTDQAGIYVYDKSLNEPKLATTATALVGTTGNNRIVSAVVDPCQKVLYAMLNQSAVMLEVPLSDTSLVPRRESVKVDGVAIGYDHPTRSILVVESLNIESGIDSWSITGSSSVPDLTQNIVGWTRPVLQPKYMAVAQPKNIVCPIE